MNLERLKHYTGNHYIDIDTGNVFTLRQIKPNMINSTPHYVIEGKPISHYKMLHELKIDSELPRGGVVLLQDGVTFSVTRSTFYRCGNNTDVVFQKIKAAFSLSKHTEMNTEDIASSLNIEVECLLHIFMFNKKEDFV